MINPMFGIYEANKIISFSYPTANTVGYIRYAPTEHLKDVVPDKSNKSASEKRNKNNPMRLALGKITENNIGFVRSHTKVITNKNIKEAKCS